MPVPPVDARSLEKGHRSAGEQLKVHRGTAASPAGKSVPWRPNLNASMQTHVAWGINKRSQI